MLIVEIVFWFYDIGCFVKLCFCVMDHPRKPSEVNVGVDIISFLISVALTIFLGLYIW